MPDVILHGDIQRAKRTAEDSGYEIKPAPKGFYVWRHIPGFGWRNIAQFQDQQAAEDFVFSQIAILGR